MTITREPVELSVAIADLYEMFARYPLPNDTRPDGICAGSEDDARLRSKPLRRLSWEDFGVYPIYAARHWGDRDTLRHFIPRMLELTASPLGWQSDELYPDSFFLYFSTLEWRNWTLDEQLAVEEFVRSLWFNVVQRTEYRMCGVRVTDWLTGLFYAVADMSMYIQVWQSNPSTAAALAVAEIIAERPSLVDSFEADEHWFPWEDSFLQLGRWLRSASARSMLSTLGGLGRDTCEMGTFDQALALLELHPLPQQMLFDSDCFLRASTL
jgi:hypothetical protein